MASAMVTAMSRWVACIGGGGGEVVVVERFERLSEWRRLLVKARPLILPLRASPGVLGSCAAPETLNNNESLGESGPWTRAHWTPSALKGAVGQLPYSAGTKVGAFFCAAARAPPPEEGSERENTAEQECERKRRGRTGTAGERKEKSEREREDRETGREERAYASRDSGRPATETKRPQPQANQRTSRSRGKGTYIVDRSSRHKAFAPSPL